MHFVPTLDSNDAEPDDRPSQAIDLPVNSTTQGHIQYYYDTKTDRADWYKIDLPVDGMLKLRLSADNNLNLVQFKLFDTRQNVIKKGIVAELRQKDFLIDGLGSGKYYLVIYGKGWHSYSSYILSDSLFTYKYASDSKEENNNLPYLATEVKNRQPVEGHVGFLHNKGRDSADWWKINQTDIYGNIRLLFSLLPSLADNTLQGLQVELYDDTLLAPVFSKILNNAADTISLEGLKQGMYYLKITNAHPDSGWNAYAFELRSNSVLPVTFIKFSGSVINNKPILEWISADEINCKGFEVQRAQTACILIQ